MGKKTKAKLGKKMAGPKGKPFRREPVVNIDINDGERLVIPATGLCVEGSVGLGVQSVAIKLIHGDETIPDPTSLVAGDFVSPFTPPDFSKTVAYGGASATPPDSGPYKIVAYGATSTVALKAVTVVNFTRWPQTQEIFVSSKDCIWFTFAGFGASGPYGEEDPKSHASQTLRVPINATSVSFSADSTGRWRHFASDPASESDADGRSGVVVELEKTEYRDAALGSDGITPVPTEVGKLVGMWMTDTGYQEFAIGLTRQIDIPVEAIAPDDYVHLGYHDGKRWFNNDGNTIKVNIEWNVPTTCPPTKRSPSPIQQAKSQSKGKGKKKP